MMKSRALSAVFLSCLVSMAVACQQDDSSVQPATFDRPGDIAFACFDGVLNTMVAVSNCEQSESAQERFALIALVTQTGRGEVASVDLLDGRVLDIEPGVPGFTFVRVQAVPVAVVVPPESPTFTYVASFGARRIEAIPTSRFHPDAEGGEESRQELVLDGAPTDMVLGPEGQALYVTVPEPRTCAPDAGTADGGTADGGAIDGGTADGGTADGGATDGGSMDAGSGGDGGSPDGGASAPCAGRLYRIPLDDQGRMGTPEIVSLVFPSTKPDLPLPADSPPSAVTDTYRFICAPDDPPALASELTAPSSTVDLSSARPAALRLDEEEGHLLVADEGLPIIHRIDVTTEMPAALPALDVGVPTRDLAVTPPVPAQVGGDASTEGARYLYAIDHDDQSVLVVDYTPGSSAFGAVLPVSAGPGAKDRIDFNADARVIEIVTPDFPGPVCSSGQSFSEEVGPGQLRGVFLAAGLSDGTLRIADVHDLDVPCLQCSSSSLRDGTQWFLRRHAPRIGQRLTETYSLVAAPLFRVEGAATRVLETGEPESGEAPDLSSLGECPAGKTRAYPEAESSPLICVSADPWSSRPQRWSVVWEGSIPGTASGRGRLRLDGGAPVVDVEGGALCDRGVIGRDDVPTDPAAPLSEYRGDVLVVTSELPPTTDDPECERLFGGEDRPEIGFHILEASQTELALGAPVGSGYDFDAVRECFRQIVSVRVRTRGVYTVSGSSAGWLHPIEAAPDDSCRVAPDAPPQARGRAFQGQPFENRDVAFEIDFFGQDGSSPPAGLELDLLFDVTGIPSSIGVPLGVLSSGSRVSTLPSALRFAPVNDRLYLVDSANRGLLEFDLVQFQLRRAFD